MTWFCKGLLDFYLRSEREYYKGTGIWYS
jgi:hypothetical protein